MSTTAFGCLCGIMRSMFGTCETWCVHLCACHAKALFGIGASMWFDRDIYDGDLDVLARRLVELLHD